MSTSDIISIALGVLSFVLAILGIYLVFYYEIIKNRRNRIKAVIDTKILYEFMIAALKDTESTVMETLSTLIIFRRHVSRSLLDQKDRQHIESFMDVIFYKFDIQKIINEEGSRDKSSKESKDLIEEKFKMILKIIQDIPWFDWMWERYSDALDHTRRPYKNLYTKRYNLLMDNDRVNDLWYTNLNKWAEVPPKKETKKTSN